MMAMIPVVESTAIDEVVELDARVLSSEVLLSMSKRNANNVIVMK